MGAIAHPHPVKLLFGFIYREERDYSRAKRILERRFGAFDHESPVLLFNLTGYYEKEMGKGLKRRFASSRRLILPGKLPAIKIYANSLEKKLSRDQKRTVNIDPGYLDQAKFILASTKDYVHRIYLDKGIYAETTLFYRGHSFIDWQWTYPDFRTKEYISVLNHIRGIYAAQIKNSK